MIVVATFKNEVQFLRLVFYKAQPRAQFIIGTIPQSGLIYKAEQCTCEDTHHLIFIELFHVHFSNTLFSIII